MFSQPSSSWNTQQPGTQIDDIHIWSAYVLHILPPPCVSVSPQHLLILNIHQQVQQHTCTYDVNKKAECFGEGQASSFSHEASHHSSPLWCLDTSTRSFSNRWSPRQTKKEVPKPQLSHTHTPPGKKNLKNQIETFGSCCHTKRKHGQSGLDE